ncbi:MAG: hypothetical protein RLZZ200_2471 [Pseudomonadota bacterium]|jgi:signal transduction histidine kinase
MNPETVSAGKWSLQRRLLLLLGSLIIVLMGTVTTAFYLDSRKASQQLFDNSLEVAGRLLLQLAEHEVAEHGSVLGLQLLAVETRPDPFALRYQVWSPDMREAQRLGAATVKPLLSLEAEGFDWIRVEGETWRAFAVWNATHTVQVQLVQSPHLRQSLASETLVHLVTTILVLLLLAGLALRWILARTVKLVARIANAVAQRSPDDATPFIDPGAPAEVRPLLSALNGLLDRVGAKLASEQRFTADASHELRTPLAAIKTNAQALVGARNDEERALASSGLLSSVDRCARVVDQLLALARADAKGLTDRSRQAVTSLDELARAQVWELAEAASRRAIALSLDAVPVSVKGDFSLLSILLRNLVDNAIRYTPVGGAVRVVVSDEDGCPVLSVTDSGPGIPRASREQVFERFFRLPGNSESGSGLGLSIVSRIATLHGATVSVGTAQDGHGARFEVRFPLT